MWNSPLEVKQKKILNVVIQISVIYVLEIFFKILPDKKIGLSSFFALSKASFPHGYLTKKGKKKNKTWHLAMLSESMSIWSLKSTHQSTGLCACCSRYGDLSLANLLECLWEVDDGPSLPDAILMKADGLDTQDAYECGSWFLLAKQSNLDVAASVWAQIQWPYTMLSQPQDVIVLPLSNTIKIQLQHSVQISLYIPVPYRNTVNTLCSISTKEYIK